MPDAYVPLSGVMSLDTPPLLKSIKLGTLLGNTTERIVIKKPSFPEGGKKRGEERGGGREIILLKIQAPHFKLCIFRPRSTFLLSAAFGFSD